MPDRGAEHQAGRRRPIVTRPRRDSQAHHQEEAQPSEPDRGPWVSLRRVAAQSDAPPAIAARGSAYVVSLPRVAEGAGAIRAEMGTITP